MRRLAGRIAFLASLLVLLSIFLWSRWPASPPPTPPEASAGDTASKVQDNDTTPLAGSPPHESAPVAPLARVELPADDAPLAGILGPLAERADAGDRKAACRLAMELLRCEHLLDYSVSVPNLADPASGEGKSEWERGWIRWNGHWLEQCKAVPDALRGQGGRYLAQAARAGEPEALVRYADGHHWPPSGRGVFAGPDFDRWRRDAPGMMQRALESGYPGAVFTLMVAYGDDHGLHAALVPNDAEQALVMSLLYSRLYGANEMPHYRNAVDAATLIRARARAEEMHVRHFNGRRYHGHPYPTTLFVPPLGGDTTHGFCREP